MATAQTSTESMNSKAPTEAKAKINKKVNKAIQLLNEARTEQVQHTSSRISDTFNRTKEQAMAMKDRMSENLNEYSDKAEEKVKAHPFYYLAGFAVIGSILGFLFGKRR